MTDSSLELIRRMPPEQASEYARGVLSLLRFRPDLRKLYSTADLAFLQHAASVGASPRRYTKEAEPDDAGDGGDLARMYAGMLNARLDADEEVRTKDLDAIADELEGTDWCIDYCEGRWEAKACGPLKYEKNRSPKGGCYVGGRFYRGGQFIPDGDLSKAPPSIRSAIKSATLNRKTQRARRGPVDAGKIGKRLDKHKGVELTDDDRKAAARSLKALQRYHGDLTGNRIEELIDAAEKSYEAAKPEAKAEHAKRLRMLQSMLDEVESPEAKTLSADRATAERLELKLKPWENEELSHGDVMAGVARWTAIQKDYGEHVPAYLDETSDRLIAEMNGQLARLPKGAKESRRNVTRETGKQLALLAWMADRWKEEHSAPEPDFGEALDRIQYAEKQRGGKTPWTAFMIQAVADEFGWNLSDVQSDSYTSPEALWNRIKEGNYFGPRMAEALKRIPRENGTLTERQLRQVLPYLKERTDTITDEVASKIKGAA